MSLHIYSLISYLDHEEDSALIRFLSHVHKKLKEGNTRHSLPKLDWCITMVTPFPASSCDVAWLALGIKLGSYDTEGKGFWRTRTMNFAFVKETEETSKLVLTLETPPSLKETVSKTKSILAHLTKKPPDKQSFEALLHILVAEQIPNESIKRRKIFWEKFFLLHSTTFAVSVNRPTLVLQGDDDWFPVMT